jgi:hypothetical protein
MENHPTPAMPTTPPLSGSHLRTYETIFQHPISHNLEWRAVHSLLGKLGQVTEEANGNLKVTRNGQTLVLRPAHTKDVSEPEEVMALRHFLERSEALPAPADEKDAQWLLVIDHHEARIFRSAGEGASPQLILPHAPEDYFRHAPNSKDFSRGRERPDPNTFFAPVAKALPTAGKILVFGSGTGMSSEMDQFIAWAKQHQPELAARIVGQLVVDEHHLTDSQLLAKAREYYAKARKA